MEIRMSLLNVFLVRLDYMPSHFLYHRKLILLRMYGLKFRTKKKFTRLAKLLTLDPQPLTFFPLCSTNHIPNRMSTVMLETKIILRDKSHLGLIRCLIDFDSFVSNWRIIINSIFSFVPGSLVPHVIQECLQKWIHQNDIYKNLRLTLHE